MCKGFCMQAQPSCMCRCKVNFLCGLKASDISNLADSVMKSVSEKREITYTFITLLMAMDRKHWWVYGQKKHYAIANSQTAVLHLPVQVPKAGSPKYLPIKYWDPFREH